MDGILTAVRGESPNEGMKEGILAGTLALWIKGSETVFHVKSKTAKILKKRMAVYKGWRLGKPSIS